jgi:hypothetical protein
MPIVESGIEKLRIGTMNQPRLPPEIEARVQASYRRFGRVVGGEVWAVEALNFDRESGD